MSAIFKNTGVTAAIILLIPNAKVAIGIASATAASTLFPMDMANAVAKTPPTFTSGGMYAPTEIAPMNNNSRLAPMIIP